MILVFDLVNCYIMRGGGGGFWLLGFVCIHTHSFCFLMIDLQYFLYVFNRATCVVFTCTNKEEKLTFLST